MGLTFAKSVKFGAVRFNFSGAGIGMSVGIPGLRIGTGPRGAYISGGKGGFRYRRSLGRVSAPASSTSPTGVTPSYEAATAPSPDVLATVEHDTKNVLELTDSSSDALLQSMNEQRRKGDYWPAAAIGLGFLFLMIRGIGATWPGFVHLLIFLTFVGVTAWVRWRDKMRKLTVLFFEPDAPASGAYEELLASFTTASNVVKLRSVAQTSTYADTKYSAGASKGLKLVNGDFHTGQAPGVIANIDVPLLRTDKTTLAFYPDRVLAFQGKSVGAIDYHDLQSASKAVQYIESESVPSDANVIDHTWQYVNKKGGPDQRFKNNKRLPICRYNEFQLGTQSGLDIQFIGSKDTAFDSFAQTLAKMSKPLGTEQRDVPA